MHSSIFDILLVFALMYFFLATMYSSLMQMIFMMLQVHRNQLRQLFQKMFTKQTLLYLQKSRFLRGFDPLDAAQKSKKFPAKISSDVFVHIFIQGLGGTSLEQMKERLIADDHLVRLRFKRKLLQMMEQADTQETFKAVLAKQYAHWLEQGQGLIHKKMRPVGFIIAFSLVFGCNADSIYVFKTLWTQPDLTTSIVKNEQGYAEKIFQIQNTQKQVLEKEDTVEKKRDAQEIEEIKRELKKNFEVFQEAYAELHPLPLGWHANNSLQNYVQQGAGFWLLKITGWLLTTLAIMLGAPFWQKAISQLNMLRRLLPQKAPRTQKGVKR